MPAFRNKRSIAALSALLILGFHLWVRLWPGSTAERFLQQTAYLGVDLFFFTAAFAVGRKEVTDYRSYIRKRFRGVYVMFILFAIVAAVYSGWKWSRLLRVIFGVELAVRGGGSFLWFLPVIMVVYLLLPLYQKLCKKFPRLAPVMVLAVWAAVGIAVTARTNYHGMFIYWNRIPVILLGYHAPALYLRAKACWKPALEGKKWLKPVLGLVLLAIGMPILYQFGFTYKLHKPIWELFYVLDIPAMLGVLLLADCVPENAVIRKVGSATLEIYAVQMIFGYHFANKMLRMTGSAALTDLLVLAFVVGFAVIISTCKGWVVNGLKKRRIAKTEG